MLPYKNPVISIVLGSYNRRALLRATIESVRADVGEYPYEIIVVDGGSTDGSLKYLANQKDIITIVQHNHGIFNGRQVERRSWGYFMNLAFKAARGKYILMISDDCLLVPGAIKNGVERYEELLSEGQKVGAMAFYWRNWPEQKEYWVGLALGGKMHVNHGLFLRDALEEVGWIDEETYQFYHADSDLCLKLWHSGFRVVDCETAYVEHCDEAKSSRISNVKDWEAFLNKWEGIFYESRSNNGCGWIYRSYTDPYRTYLRFPLSIRVRIRLNRVFMRIRLGINNVLTHIWLLGKTMKRLVKRYVFPET